MAKKLSRVTFSYKILSLSIINCRGVFWHLVSVQTHGSVTQGLLGLYFIVPGVTPTALCIVLMQGCLRSEYLLRVEHVIYILSPDWAVATIPAYDKVINLASYVFPWMTFIISVISVAR